MLHKRRLVVLYYVYNCDISTGVSCHYLVSGGNAVIRPEEWGAITDSSGGQFPEEGRFWLQSHLPAELGRLSAHSFHCISLFQITFFQCIVSAALTPGLFDVPSHAASICSKTLSIQGVS